jgi:uncharacterized Zn-finger protein
MFRPHTSVLLSIHTSAHAFTVGMATCHPKKRVPIGKVSSAATKIALLRASETPQGSAYQKDRAAASRASETPPETEARLADQRNRAAASRASETPQETDARLASLRNRAAASRASESQRETEARLAYQRNRAATSRASEGQRETKARLAYQRNRVAVTGACVTPADLRFIAFAYNPNVNYHEHPKVFISKMDAVCTYCAATKWKDEPPGLCCSNGKVHLPPLLPPCKPRQSLMCGYTSDSKHFLQHIRQ